MTNGNNNPAALAKTVQSGGELAGWSNKEAFVIHQMYAEATNQAEFMAFGRICRVTGYDPQKGEIHCTVYNKDNPKKRKMVVVIGVNGYRKTGWSTGEVLALEGPQWMTEDREWVDVWLEDYNPLAARFGIQRDPMISPRWMTVTWREFAKDVSKAEGDFWRRMPSHMLAKTAESQCWRAVFPSQIADVESTIEKAGGPTVVVKVLDEASEFPQVEGPAGGAWSDVPDENLEHVAEVQAHEAAAREPFDLERETAPDGAQLKPERSDSGPSNDAEKSDRPTPKGKAKGITPEAVLGALEVAMQVGGVDRVQVGTVTGADDDDGVVKWIIDQMDETTMPALNTAIAQLVEMAAEVEVGA